LNNKSPPQAPNKNTKIQPAAGAQNFENQEPAAGADKFKKQRPPQAPKKNKSPPQAPNCL